MATRVFYWDCEAGALSDYFDFNVAVGTTLSTEQAYSGTKSVKWNGNVDNAGGLAVRAPASFTGSGLNQVSWGSTLSEIYLRWKMYIASSTAGAASGNHGFRLYNLNSPTFNEIDTVAGTKSGSSTLGWGIVLFDFDASPHVDGPTQSNLWTYPLDTWFEFAFYAKLNTMSGSTANSDGICKAWVDGSLEHSDTAVKFRGNNAGAITYTGWDAFYLTTNYDNPGADSHWYQDIIEVWDGIPSSDTTNPVCTIDTPTSSPTYTTANQTPSVAGTASDDTAVTSVTWSNAAGGSGTATGTTSWSFTPTLSIGSNVITVTAHDAAGNTGTDVITITYAPATSALGWLHP